MTRPEQMVKKTITRIEQHVNGRGPEAVVSFTDGTKVAWVLGQVVPHALRRIEFPDDSGMNVMPGVVRQATKEVTLPHELGTPPSTEILLLTLVDVIVTDRQHMNPGFFMSIGKGMSLFFAEEPTPVQKSVAV